MMYKYCRRCGRRLKGEENRRRGYGETCFRKTQSEARANLCIVAPLSNYPIEVITDAEQSDEAQSAEPRGRGSREEPKSNQNEARPPHLEETLSPSYKKPLLFMPHAATPTPL